MLDEILDLIIASGLALSAECTAGFRLPLPLRQLTLYSTPGEPPLRSMDNVIDRPRVQFTFRDSRYDLATAWAEGIWKLCERTENQMLGATPYLYLAPIASITGMGEDDNNNPIVGFNVRVARVIIP